MGQGLWVGTFHPGRGLPRQPGGVEPSPQHPTHGLGSIVTVVISSSPLVLPTSAQAPREADSVTAGAHVVSKGRPSRGHRLAGLAQRQRLAEPQL